eukprot:SAG11_NODE_1223_length_5482_cov_6.386773_1_plen_120_part_00
MENSQLAARLIAAESEKAGLLVAAGTPSGSQKGQDDEKAPGQVAKKKKISKTFNAGAKESIEEFLLELKQAFQRAQVKNEEQRLSTLLGALGEIISSDYGTRELSRMLVKWADRRLRPE